MLHEACKHPEHWPNLSLNALVVRSLPYTLATVTELNHVLNRDLRRYYLLLGKELDRLELRRDEWKRIEKVVAAWDWGSENARLLPKYVAGVRLREKLGKMSRGELLAIIAQAELRLGKPPVVPRPRSWRRKD
jgi:hypothetical protein